jgi:hypothetical protein
MPLLTRTLLLASASAAIACAGATTVARDSAPLPPAAAFEHDSTVQTLVNRLDLETFRKHIQEMSQIDFTATGRFAFLRQVTFIEEQLESYGYRVSRDEVPTVNILHSSLVATKLGSATPDEMYILSANIGGGSNSNSAACALLLEIARVLASPDLITGRSVRLIFWDNPGGSSNLRRLASVAYVSDRSLLEGKSGPDERGDIPEPKWLGVIEHSRVLFDHELRPGSSEPATADMDAEYRRQARQSRSGEALANYWKRAAELYAPRYKAQTGDRMSESSHSYSFMDHVAAITVSAHQTRDVQPYARRLTYGDRYESYTPEDFRFAFNFAQTSLAAVSHLISVRLLTSPH